MRLSPELRERLAARRREQLCVEQDDERDTITIEGVTFRRDFFRAASGMATGEEHSAQVQMGTIDARVTLKVSDGV